MCFENSSISIGLHFHVLVVDSLSMKMVSACTKMHELSAEGITSTEHVFIYRYTECMFSCGDNREEKRTNACNGGHLLDRIYRGLSEVSPTGLLQSEQNYLQGSSCILHWRWAGIMLHGYWTCQAWLLGWSSYINQQNSQLGLVGSLFWGHLMTICLYYFIILDINDF